MKNRISKRFLITIVSSVLTVATVIVFACAGGDDFSDFYKSFFAPETSRTDEAKPFYRSFQTFYGSEYFYDAIHEMDSTNLDEWKTFFNRKITGNDMNYIVYQSRIGEVDTCIFYLKNSSYPIKPYLKKNSVLAFEDKNLVREFLFYLGFAKRCEPYATYTREWWSDDNSNDPRLDTVSMRKLLNGGKKSLLNAKSAFLKERYAFQVTRLYYQMGLYNECVSFYNDNKPLFASQTTIPYRALGYVAASYYKLGMYSHANYIYAQVFDNCETMRKTSFLSFHPQNEDDWNEALNMAKTTREKEVLWQLLGIYADPVRAMNEIYALNPKSDLLDLLVVRAVNINEEEFIPGDYYGDSEGAGYMLVKKKVDTGLLDFSQKLATAGNTNKPYLWNLVAGFLQMAQGNYKQSEKLLSKAESLSKGDKLVNEQIRAFRIMNKVEEYIKPDPKIEETLTRELTWIEKEDQDPSLRGGGILNWALSRLSEKYRSWGDSVKAQCLDYRQNKNFYYHPQNMEALIAFMDKPGKTSFEKFILTHHPYSKDELFNYKAIVLIYQYKFREALAMFDACKGSGDQALLADPFIIHINDCHDCDYIAPNGDSYSSYTLVQKLIELEDKASKDPKNAAQYYFQIANGLYNMTYFGNAHHVFSSALIDLNVGYFYFDADEIAKYYPYLDCRKAMEYYQKAMNASSNNEFKAKCCFMAAKCEQNQFFISSEFNYDNSIRSGVFFRQLKTDYSKTKYYQEIIKECGYFRKFLGMK